ncbi:MAG: hypothetical protein ACE5Q6_01080 [Dehalococcoidia bacterium]
MAKQNRQTLIGYFKKGSIPTQDQFEDLVDSTVNIIDDGLYKTPQDGLKLSQYQDGKLISFYKNSLVSNPLYFLNLDQDDNLILRGGRQRKILLLPEPGEPEPEESQEQLKVGINIDAPENELHVGGVIRSEGRIGVASKVGQQKLEVSADGVWHSITGTLNGCQAFEVMAGVGGRQREGRYALTHAFALNTYNPKGWLFNFLNLKKRIRYQSAYYRSRADKLRLRWKDGEDHSYSLQIKSNTHYGDDIKIRYYLTKLWFDEELWFDEDASGSRSNPDEDIG